MDRAPLDYVDALRQRAAQLATRANTAESPEAREAFEDLARMYEEMANAVAELERLRRRA